MSDTSGAPSSAVANRRMVRTDIGRTDVMRADSRSPAGLKAPRAKRGAFFREYVLVSLDPRAEVYRRETAGSWEYIDVSGGGAQRATAPTSDLGAVYRRPPLWRIAVAPLV